MIFEDKKKENDNDSTSAKTDRATRYNIVFKENNRVKTRKTECRSREFVRRKTRTAATILHRRSHGAKVSSRKPSRGRRRRRLRVYTDPGYRPYDLLLLSLCVHGNRARPPLDAFGAQPFSNYFDVRTQHLRRRPFYLCCRRFVNASA